MLRFDVFLLVVDLKVYCFLRGLVLETGSNVLIWGIYGIVFIFSLGCGSRTSIIFYSSLFS